jgi:hypothetical protein
VSVDSLTTRDGLCVPVSAVALKYLRTVDLDLNTLFTDSDGLVRGYRKSKAAQVNPVAVSAYAALVEPIAVAQAVPVIPAPAQAVQAVPEVPAVPALGVRPPAHPEKAQGPRDVIHDHDLKVVFVPLLDVAEYVVLAMRDYYDLRDGGLHVRIFRVERDSKAGKKGRKPLAITTTKRNGRQDVHYNVAELLMLCEPHEAVEFHDSNPARLLRSNMRKVCRQATP